MTLTIGIPVYDDFDGDYFTLQALRPYQDLADAELLVVDNFGCEHTRALVEERAQARYVRAAEAVGTAAAKNRVFAEARGDAVLCCDAHICAKLGVHSWEAAVASARAGSVLRRSPQENQ